jgi:hypothetical protein
MAHWAELDENNVVLRVLVGDNNDPANDEGYQWLLDNLGGTWKKTSYNTVAGVHTNGGTPFRKNYAGIGTHMMKDAMRSYLQRLTAIQRKHLTKTHVHGLALTLSILQ